MMNDPSLPGLSIGHLEPSGDPQVWVLVTRDVVGLAQLELDLEPPGDDEVPLRVCTAVLPGGTLIMRNADDDQDAGMMAALHKVRCGQA